MGKTIQDILKRAWDDYREDNRVPEYVDKAIAALRWCRTAALGGHVKKCPAGHVAGIWYNSCRHRACPQCAWGKIEAWLAAKKVLILPCDHYHIIFTVPDTFRIFWMWNRKLFADLLFQHVRGTLFDLLAGPRRLRDAKCGFIATLHTWGRNLVAHPHIHCLVIGGGLTPDGRWRSPRKDGYFLPVRQVAKEFRDRFCDALMQHIDQGELELPSNLTRAMARRIVRRAKRKRWNVRIPPAYSHGRGVATYLSRYCVGGPIKNHQLLSFDKRSVTFRYDDHRTHRRIVLTLKIAEFLRRLVLHIPLPGMRVVRSYGLYHHSQREKLEQARKLLGGGSVLDDDDADRTGAGETSPQESEPLRCPVCQRELVRGAELARGTWEVPSWAPAGLPPPHASLLEIG